MMPGSKIVLPSSNVDDYTATALRSTISSILNPTSVKGGSSKEIYKIENCPSWWPKDVLFSPVLVPKAVTNGITAVHRRKILAAFLEKCPDQYTILSPIDQQNSASAVETDQPEDPAVGTRMTKIVLPSSDAEEYSGNILRDTFSRIVNPKGLKGVSFHSSENCPSWWPKDVAFCILSGPKATMNGITAEHQKKVLAAFLEKCPEQYTISLGAWLLNPPSSPLVGDKQPVREVNPQSSSESDQEEPVGMNQTPPTGANRTRSVGATISTAAQHASPKLILPSSCANYYHKSPLILLIRKILNPLQRMTYSSANCPSWWPTDVPFTRAEDMKSEIRRKVLAAFLENCPDQYTISPPVDEQNSASTVETDQPEDPAVGTKTARMMPGSKIVLPSSNVENYSGVMLRGIISRIVNPKGWTSRNIYTDENRPSWWPKDVVFTPATGRKAIENGITTAPLRKVLAAFLEKCPEQYTISPPVDQQNSASTVETNRPKVPAVRTRRARMMPGSKIVLPSSDVYEYSGNILQSLMPRIANSKGCKGRTVYTSGNRPNWWPKDVAFASMTGSRTIGIATAMHRRKVLAAFLEKCPEQYTISPGAWLLNPTSSPLVGNKQPVREVSPQSFSESSSESFSESDQEEPVRMNQTPPTGAYRTRSVGAATISTAAQHANPKLILPSLCANDYYQPALISLLQNILNPQRRQFIYSSTNCPSWWPTDIPFIRAEDIEAKDRTKVLTAFLEKCSDQYTISPPVDQQNSASTVETDQPEDPAVGTKRARIMPGSKIVLPSSNVEEYSGLILRGTIAGIVNPKGIRNFYTKDNCPSWWPKDVVFTPVTGPKAIANGITIGHQRKIMAAFLEKCPEQYTISPRKRLLYPTSSPQSSSESSSESDQEEPVGMNQTPPTGAYRTRSVGATISTAAQHASPKLIIPSSYVNGYSQPSLISLIQKILNPERRHFIYSSANCPSWWPTDIPFTRAEDMKAKDRRRVLTSFLRKCSDQYTISPPVDQQNSTKKGRMMPSSKIVLTSSNAEEYYGNVLQSIISRILNPEGLNGIYVYMSDNCPTWWPKDVAFSPMTGPKAIANGITVSHRRKVLAAFLEKCPDQYIISPPVDQQNSAVGTKRARMISGSKIVLPSSDVYEYSGKIIRSTISRIVNPEGQNSENFYTSDNCPSWWPKDVAFTAETCGQKCTA